MNKIKRAYYFAFYIIYLHAKRSSTIFSHEFIASLYIIILEISLLISFTNYYNLILDTNAGIVRNEILIMIVLFLAFIDYLIFHKNDKWKSIVKEFDNLPKKQIEITKWKVYSVVIFVILNFIFSYYLIFAQSKKNQTGPYAPEIVAKERMEDSLQKAKQIENLKKIYGEDKK